MHTFIDTIIGYGTLILQVLIGVSLLLILLEKYFWTPLPDIIRTYGILIGFILSLCAILGSLYYSEIRNLPPCTFCWWQRIFMYPQCAVFGSALVTREYRSARWTSMILSLVGLSIAIIHVLAQSGIRSQGLPCAANGVSCTSIDLMLLGYITIPIMSLTLYGTMILVQTFGAFSEKQT